jgi:hypothetical protein
MKNGVPVSILADRQGWIALSETEVRVFGAAPPSLITRSINVQAIGCELSEFSGHVTLTAGQPV